ncbi:MAG TPA: fibronectin type III domain-containing protein, partial [Polyangiaceae bacterium]|nr:fibronectin type III domain-containing protein [Polyangiaceae bacterium]
MSRLSRVGLIALALSAASAVGCGSDSAKPPAAGSGGSSGKTDAGSTGGVDVGDGGSSSGGAEGIDSGPPPDTTPPTFAGVKAVEAKGEDAVVVSWDAATDPPNGDAKIAYVVYRAATQGGEDYTRAHRCGDPSIDAGTADVSHVPCFASTGSGETSITLRGVVPGTEYFYVVRAIDASGNEDDNTKEASATTADETKPDFAGVRSVTVVSATSVNVTWGAGYDVGTPDPELVFKVYAKEDVTPDPATDTPVYTSKPGERSTIVGGLTPRGFYKVVVHATDQAGHSDDNGRVLGITMPEGDPPAFDGIRGATGEGDTTIRLFWTPAKDNQTPDASIVYDVFMSTVSHGEKFDKPPFATSTPGAASILLTTGLQQGSKYYFVVRARDYVGNRDSNTVEKGVTTSTPDVTKPTFGGVTGVTGTSPTALKVTWDPANDDRTLFATDFTYRVYASTSATVPTTTPYV